MIESDTIETAAATTPRTVGLLDFCKGVAIVWVVLVHALHGWFGWQGAHVFIVLAGGGAFGRR